MKKIDLLGRKREREKHKEQIGYISSIVRW